MVSIYILQLEGNKYYAGRTVNPDIRIDKHFNNNGSYWTSKYKPIKVIKVMNNCSVFDEDKYTLQLMSMYGIDNVRGGSFTKLVLPENEIEVITKMINNAGDYCFNCYEKDHFIRECPYKPFSNMPIVMLKNKLLGVYHEEFIEVDVLIGLLSCVDNVIFKDLEKKNIYSLCKKINKRQFKGVGEIVDSYVKYRDFVIGVCCLLDWTTGSD